MVTGFPYSRTIITIHSTRTEKKSGKSSTEERHYLSSQAFTERLPLQWIELVRSHWAGVENRNHYRRDATLREDSTRCRNPHIVGNLALMRSALLCFGPDEQDEWLPAQTERLAAQP